MYLPLFFMHGMEPRWDVDIQLGNLSETPTKHLASNKSRLSQIKDGKWTVISGYVGPD